MMVEPRETPRWDVDSRNGIGLPFDRSVLDPVIAVNAVIREHVLVIDTHI